MTLEQTQARLSHLVILHAAQREFLLAEAGELITEARLAL